MAAYLLDTHIFIWLDSEPDKLPKKILDIINDPSNVLWLSNVSLWEMQIKRQLGKLRMNISISVIVESQIKTNHLQLLDIKIQHILNLENLPDHHKDPFDRMLVSQALSEKMPLISHDPIVHKYPLEVIW